MKVRDISSGGVIQDRVLYSQNKTGREVWTMLKQDQIDVEGQTAFERFYALAV